MNPQPQTMLELVVGTDTPIDLALTLRRYQAFGPDAANRWDGRLFRKVLHLDGILSCLHITDEGQGLRAYCVPPLPTETGRRIAETHARHILGLNFDLPEFYTFARTDPVLQRLTHAYHGLRPTLQLDPFEVLVTAISAQQINLRFAFTVRSRLIREYGSTLELGGETLHAFPTPEQIAGTDPSHLHALQFTRRKAEYIVGLAEKFASGELDPEELHRLPDAHLREKLLALRGIGAWCVDWFLARCRGEGSAFPAGDLGVRKAVHHFYFPDEQQSEQALREHAGRWGEWANLAVHYLLTGWMDSTSSQNT